MPEYRGKSFSDWLKETYPNPEEYAKVLDSIKQWKAAGYNIGDTPWYRQWYDTQYRPQFFAEAEPAFRRPQPLQPGQVMTKEQYATGLGWYLEDMVNAGLITHEYAAQVIDQTAERIRIEGDIGITHMPYYNQIARGKTLVEEFAITPGGMYRWEDLKTRKPREYPPVPGEPELPAYAPTSFAPGKIYQDIIAQLPTPALREHYGGMFSRLYSEFEAEQPGAMESWLEGRYESALALERGVSHYKGTREKTRRLAEAYGAGKAGGTYVERQAERHESARSRIRRLAAQRGQFGLDPFSQWLGEYDLAGKYMRTPPEQRGFYSSRYVPHTRWLV